MVKNYVSSREQFVCIEGCYSNKARLLCGVPQGSILGPLLFLIYINDLSNVTSMISPIIFADDTNMLLSHSNFYSLMQEANSGLIAYAEWFRLNKVLYLSMSKNPTSLFSVVKRLIVKI